MILNVCNVVIEEHKDGSFLICRLKAIANELGQSEALVGGTSALAEPGLPRAEERLRLQPPGKAIDNESLWATSLPRLDGLQGGRHFFRDKGLLKLLSRGSK